MYLAHGGNHGTHPHHQIFNQIGNDHDPCRFVNIDAKVAPHGKDETKGNNDRRGAGTQGNQEIRNLPATDLRTLQKIAHGHGNQNANGGGGNGKEEGIFQAGQHLVPPENGGPVAEGEIIGIKQGFAQIHLQRGNQNSAKGNHNHQDRKEGHQPRSWEAPPAQLHDVGVGALAGDGDVLFFGQAQIRNAKHNHRQRHQKQPQAHSIIHPVCPPAHIVDDAGSHGVHPARSANDGRNAIAAGC